MYGGVHVSPWQSSFFAAAHATIDSWAMRKSLLVTVGGAMGLLTAIRVSHTALSPLARRRWYRRLARVSPGTTSNCRRIGLRLGVLKSRATNIITHVLHGRAVQIFNAVMAIGSNASGLGQKQKVLPLRLQSKRVAPILRRKQRPGNGSVQSGVAPW